MKNSILTMGGIVLSAFFVTAAAQETTPAVPATTTTWEAKKNPTVDSINAKYKDKLVTIKTSVPVQAFPALGQYESATNLDAPSVKISPDETNKGVVWVEGLPQGKIKAMLRKSPATYKIPAQKTEDGKDVPEGTLIYDKDTNTLSIIIGKPYNDAEPLAVFAPATEEPVIAQTKTAKVKVKSKVPAQPKPWIYAGTKVETTTAMNQ